MSNAKWLNQAVSADEVVKHIKSGDKVFVHGAGATPTTLLEAMCKRPDLRDVTLYHMHTQGPWTIGTPELDGRFFSISFFTGGPMRKPIAEGRGDFMPIFLSDIPDLFLSGAVKLDVALLQLSPPNALGQATLGTSVDTALAASLTAKLVLAEVNDQMPRTLGNSVVMMNRVKAFVHTNRGLAEHQPAVQTAVEEKIGAAIADLVEDGSCLQLGIGAIPDAVLARLGNKNDLGLHTEMFSDGVIPLIQNGNINNTRKKVHPGRSVTAFINGTKKLYDFVNDNQLVEFYPCDRTNDTSLIRKNDGVMAINSAIEVDLSGQVCADSIGHTIYSGIGGQMDFMRGAALSHGGKAIIALPSTAARGKVSRITMELKPGAGVVTTRGHVHWVVTEYGAVNLHGKALRERAELLISIAHPDFRKDLVAQFKQTRNFAV
jgi:acyl-CoA hydrolase